jgi:hypothetical protein
MTEYESVMMAFGKCAGGTILMGELSTMQMAAIEKVWHSHETISWFEALGLWLLSINPERVKETKE